MDDLDVYEILVREHEAMLAAYVRGLVGDRGLAEDVCQEAFVQAYRRLDTLQRRESFAPWLRTIARNIAFGELRKRERLAPVAAETLAGMDDVFAALDRDDDGVGWRARVDALRSCFDALSEPLRDSCRLHYYDDLTAAAVADRLGTSLSAVLKRLQRAREALADCIGKRLRLEEPS